ncbi:L-dopachrome tautomerase-related protein [Acetobacter oeni]|uniref:Yellow n=1 Tax=Acetobacter oeni TaxID=304077 RepID=A0A511XMH6_9PROT|nr:L-dopachrome tautomerase-related protein [Acetobacter oeni]MBB3883674.1 sugar lactone lactonase YvrE [Acetobacter oeni]NHO19744.1 hypothetical protein [Acetobacter oeni]GBR02904.1 hypothetical protein AA21952_0898 [Acetobacter oeni LMG 21952]GEN64126.1 hypothetical protein AOE01nite_23500 [Acetobacter oeni]
MYRRQILTTVAGLATIGTFPARAATRALPLNIEAARPLPPGSPDVPDPKLVPVAQADRIWNGVTTTSDGQVFVCFPSCDRPGIQVARLLPGSVLRPFPDAQWNALHSPSWTPADGFFQVNAIRIGPDGNLWVIDAGAPGIDRPVVAGAARLFVFDPAKGTLLRTYDLAGGLRADSYIDDIRFNGPNLYATDAGAAGLLVVNIATGRVRRVLDRHPLLTDRKPMRADGRLLRNDAGKLLRVQADQLEVTPDGRYLYVQSCAGPLARIETALLDHESVGSAALATGLVPWLETGTTGGTAIDANGVLYLSDVNHRRILRITPDRHVSVFVADPRLIWSDAMWIDHDHRLWIPATQQNRTHGFQGGTQSVIYPVWLFVAKIDAGPSPLDHA